MSAMAFVSASPLRLTVSPNSPRSTANRRPPTCMSKGPKRARPSRHSPQSSSPPAPTATQLSAEAFLLSLGLSIEDARRTISRFPRLKQDPDLPSTTAPTLAYLRSSLRFSRRQVARTIRFAPHILYRTPDVFESRLDFLDTVARIPQPDRPAAVSKCPHVLWMDLEAASRVVQLVVDACPLISPAALGSVFTRVPQALISPPQRIHSNLLHIKAAGVSDPASMARVISKAPLALVYDLPTSIDKRLAYLSDELQLSPATVGKVLVAVPQILEWSIDKLLRPRIQLLQSIVGPDALPSLIDKVPSVLGIDDAIDRVLWLREHLALTDAQIRTVVREAPAVLTYSVVGNLAPKWAFISETMGGTKEDVVAVPRESLCANLQQRAMPRYAFLASMGRHDVPVIDILRHSDAEFCKSVALCDPAQFREYVDNDTYFLFFSQLL